MRRCYQRRQRVQRRVRSWFRIWSTVDPDHLTDTPTPSHAFWAHPLDQLLGILDATTQGLSSEQAALRLARHGRNVAGATVRTGLMRGFLAQLTSPITILLLVAAGLAIGVGDRVDGSIILGTLFASLSLGLWQERRATGAVERLLALVRVTTTVVRDGADLVVPLEEVVPGDLVRLTSGSGIPADARLIDAKDLHVDEAALTGEPFPVEKEPGDAPPDAPLAKRRNTIYFGTHVVSGTATAVVVHTGARTAFGAIANRLTLRPPETGFELGVRRFGYLLLEVTLVLALAIFAINVSLQRPVLDALLFTLALAVGLTPQLLPAIVTVTLSQGARHMAAHRVIVRRLVSIEDLGGMEILCTDKTGTITKGVVEVRAAEDWSGGSSPRVRLFAYLNAAFESGFANPIDNGLRAAPPPDAAGFTKVDEIPYDFARKRLSVVVADRDQRQLLITKGAVRSVLDVCTSVEDATGGITPMTSARPTVESRLETLSRDGHRCLGIAYRELREKRAYTRDDERALVFLGILSFTDPLKPGAADALRDLSALGIRTVVVTGDNRHVAARVAADAGLASDSVMTGAELDRLSEAALVSVAPHVGVFAEMEPRQKERVIVALKKAGQAVGFLGEGINDATALHAADVGISVDSAADVAKQAADIVLLDKDLAALSRGVREGRRAFANTLKYVFITTSANFGNMFSMAGASLFVPFLPLLPKQILLTNVLTDLPAMSTVADRIDPELVTHPRRWDNRSIRRFMMTFGLVSSLFDYLMFGALLLVHAPQAAFRTAWFIESVLSELFILLVIRTRRPFYQSRPGTALFATTIAVGLATVVLPWTPLAPLLGLTPISTTLLMVVAAILVLYVAASEVSKRALLRAAVSA